MRGACFLGMGEFLFNQITLQPSTRLPARLRQQATCPVGASLSACFILPPQALPAACKNFLLWQCYSKNSFWDAVPEHWPRRTRPPTGSRTYEEAKRLSSDMAKGGFSALRHIEAVIRLVQHCEGQRPNYSQLADEQFQQLADGFGLC